MQISQSLDCSFPETGARRRGRDGKRKGTFLTRIYSTGRLIKPCYCINQFCRTFPALITPACYWLWAVKRWLSVCACLCVCMYVCVCVKFTPRCRCAAARQNYATSCLLHFDMVAPLCGTSTFTVKGGLFLHPAAHWHMQHIPLCAFVCLFVFLIIVIYRCFFSVEKSSFSSRIRVG